MSRKRETEECWDIQNELKADVEFLTALNERLKSHEKGGICFRTTKLMLKLYRYYKYNKPTDLIIETMLNYNKLEPDGLNEKDRKDLWGEVDYFISLPEAFKYSRNKVQSFASSSEPASMMMLAALIDAGLKILKTYDETLYTLLYKMYAEGEDDVATETVIKEMNMPRATFFWTQNKAIQGLSTIIFGPLGERHPKFSNTEDFDRVAGRLNYLTDNAVLFEMYKAEKTEDK